MTGTNTLGREVVFHRYYDPATGQFLSVDSLVNATGQPYAYTADNPVNATDPSGTFVTGPPGTGDACYQTPEGLYCHESGGPPGNQLIPGTAVTNCVDAYAFFLSKGLANFQAAAIVGNLVQESGVSPTASQQPSGPGRGIAQWGVNDRWQSLITFANQIGGSPTSLQVQLAFMWQELNSSYEGALRALQETTNVDDATKTFELDYEAAGVPDMAARIAYAQEMLSFGRC